MCRPEDNISCHSLENETDRWTDRKTLFGLELAKQARLACQGTAERNLPVFCLHGSGFIFSPRLWVLGTKLIPVLAMHFANGAISMVPCLSFCHLL